MKNLSIVIPVFNEGSNLPQLFSQLSYFLDSPKQFNLAEVIFVDDGSYDDTLDLLEKFVAQKEKIHFIKLDKNYGKGKAVREGVLRSSGDWCVVMDADLAVSFYEINKFLPFIEKGCDILIGTRASLSSQIVLPQGKLRILMGRFFTFLARAITKVQVSDFTCGFKCFSRRVIQDIFSISIIDRWAYDVETLYLAKKKSYPIQEIGITWRDGTNTKVRIVRDTIRAFIDLIRIVVIHR